MKAAQVVRLTNWKCESCGLYYKGSDSMPAIVAPGCFFYGASGRPPWSKESNPSPVTGVVCYCVECSDAQESANA